MVKTKNGLPNELHKLIESAREVHAALDRVDHVICDRLQIHRNDLRVLNQLEQGPLSPKSIGERTGLTSGSVTALIQRLEAAGYVERAPSAKDRRSVDIGIVPKRFAQVGRLYGQCAASLVMSFKNDTDEHLSASVATMSRFAESMSEAADVLTEM